MTRNRFRSGLVVALLATIGAATLVAYAATPEGSKYVGSSKCKLCHIKQHKTWKETKHARSFEALQGAEQEDPDCLKCHTTGYGEPGGFVSLEETPKLTDTGCEACHGPGSAHAAAAKEAPDEGQWEKKINKIPQNTCIECHNPHVNQKARVEKLRQQ